MTRTAEQMARTAKQMTRTAEQMTRTAEQVIRTAEQMTRTDGQMTRTAEQMTRTVEQMTRTAGQMTRTDGQMTRTAEQMTRTDGQMTRTPEQMTRTADQTPRTAARITRTAERMTRAADNISLRTKRMTQQLVQTNTHRRAKATRSCTLAAGDCPARGLRECSSGLPIIRNRLSKWDDIPAEKSEVSRHLDRAPTAHNPWLLLSKATYVSPFVQGSLRLLLRSHWHVQEQPLTHARQFLEERSPLVPGPLPAGSWQKR